MSRQLSDAKNTIAYATMTQLAIIYIEIFLGLIFVRYDIKSAGRFAFMVTIMWIVFGIIIYIFNGYYFNVKEEFLTALAIGFTILSFLNIRRVILFFFNLFCSVVLIYIMLIDKLKSDIDPMSVLSFSDLFVLFVAKATDPSAA
ncbi:hypothetical protein S225a_06550 [Candidatus Brocadiaceae bacterium S225]|nr:hypothetical protein S225a_06550 [Candidatus Brocadiaceae bacterium S225]